MNYSGKNFIIVGIIATIAVIFVYFNSYEYFPVNKFSPIVNDDTSYIENNSSNFETVNNTSEIEKYLRNNDNQFNIIFVETNKNKYNLSLKQLCAVESAALNNPNASIIFFSINAIVNNYLRERYKNILSINFRIDQVFNDTPFNDWWKKYKTQIQKGQFNLVHTSDALRIALIWKYGGIYLGFNLRIFKS
jgi:hypothetical protein